MDIKPATERSTRSPPATLLARYQQRWPQEGAESGRFLRFLASSPDVFRREHVAGHFTGSAWLVSADGQRILLMHHRKLGRWLQPGGHADGDTDLAAVALREAGEETGLRGLTVEPDAFDIDRHFIPARNDELGHWHYDVRFIVRATDEAFTINEESNAMAWRRIAEIASDSLADESLQRMALKWLGRR